MAENTGLNAKVFAYRAHMAALPPAVAAVESATIDFNGQPMADGESPRDGLTCGALRTVLAEVTRLTALVKQQQKDAIEAEREFSREARGIADEARWQAQNDADGVPHGTY